MIILLGGLVFSIVRFKQNISTSHWRETGSKLPLVGAGVQIDKIDAYWVSSKGDARMELRAATYPCAEITLAPTQGNGALHIKFNDSSNKQASSPIVLYYRNGEFVERFDTNIQTEGNKARVNSEKGYQSQDEYMLHSIAENDPLWTMSIINRSETTQQYEQLGFSCINTKLKSKDNN